jgi:hypothetical protein
VQISILFDVFAPSYHTAPHDAKQLALDYFEIEEKVHQCLQGWDHGHCTPMVRLDSKSDNRNELGFRIRTLSYSVEFEDAPESSERLFVMD